MSVSVLTFGCRLNAYESTVMQAQAEAAGLSETVIVNTCAVTLEAERQARQAVRRVAREQPKASIIVTGCGAALDPAAWSRLPGVARVLDNRVKLAPESWGGRTAAKANFSGRARAFVPVQQGCDHRCTFCIIPYGRGPSVSRPAGGVVAEVRTMVEAGRKEVVLTGVDLTAYGADLPGRPTLGGLVRRVLALVPELPRLRLSSLDPAEIDEDLWRMIGEEERLMPHLHFSLQAGSDLILKRMKRRHSRAQALGAIRRARALRPGVAIGADLIAGFPTETDALFEETLAFVAEAEIPFLHVFPFSARPGTPAARMQAVPFPLRRERAARLREAAKTQAARYCAGFVGRAVSVLVETGGRGHTAEYIPATLLGETCPGMLVAAQVERVEESGLVAKAT
ncbi:MAG TPA: tRNA (N(6)-L-threonylcarbamoyladenosine(37)-C(2))-methylthiotransferase MtaB [Acetobacteraceae bacterium]|nr:tRNA (N(6)-L-threonylcarbamoyladenosine(37)-C(2))-methylthiotransferase MtaB [Acetobacteraceae bacterium]